MKSTGAGAEGRRSCPCKRVPLCLSSFTAAEHGDLHTLLARAGRKDEAPLSSRQDSAGNTPLHLAAQHGHVAVVSMLMNSGECNVNAAAGGATPLHRACFSGAVPTIRLLLEDPTCDLLVRDMSFGDEQTALHKSASGGRYLAVQLLLEALQMRSVLANRPSLLKTALSKTDASGRTPLDVAREKQLIQVEERRSVVRWDSVAGGPADWDKCVQLLERAQSTDADSPQGKQQQASAVIAHPLPSYLQPKRATTSASQCMDVDCIETGDGQCLTASWERAFRAALLTSVDATFGSFLTDSRSSNYAEPMDDNVSDDSERRENDKKFIAATTQPSRTQMDSNPTTTDVIHPAALGRPCCDCGRRSIALYGRGDELICKGCRRKPKMLQRR